MIAGPTAKSAAAHARLSPGVCPLEVHERELAERTRAAVEALERKFPKGSTVGVLLSASQTVPSRATVSDLHARHGLLYVQVQLVDVPHRGGGRAARLRDVHWRKVCPWTAV